MSSLSHFDLTITSSKIALLGFANHQDTMNVLAEAALRELEQHLNDIASRGSDIRGLVLHSTKPDHFIVGADIKDIESLRYSPEDPQAKVRAGAEYMQQVFQLVADLGMNTVAAIHGPCLGGGLELALACDYRLVSNDPKTKLGFPEVQLGLIPGAGGTQRLPRLIGLVPSIDLITSAKKISPRAALKLGLVHGMVGERQLLDLAIQFAHDKTRPSRRSKSSRDPISRLKRLATERNPLARKLIFQAAKQKIEQKTSKFYPAPVLALAAIRDGYQLPLNLGLKKEAGYFAELAMTSQSMALTHLFHATTHLKKSPYAPDHTTPDQPADTPAELAPDQPPAGDDHNDHHEAPHDQDGASEPRAEDRDIHQNDAPDSADPAAEPTSQAIVAGPHSPVSMPHTQRVGVVGAGFMGAGIATLAVSRGMACRLTDPSTEAISKAYQYVAKYLHKRRRRFKPFEQAQALMRLSASTATQGLKHCAVVIEAVPENLRLKQQILQDLEAKAHHDWVFASNTSALPITDIAAAAKNPARVVGMHFFSPAEKMPLCEIVKTISSDKSALQQAFHIAQTMGKQVIVVDDGPGFYTTRTLAFFLAESIRLLENGAKVEAIDSAMKQFGFPVGPLTLLDEVGIDVGTHVLETMRKAFPGRIYDSPNITKMIDGGYLGRKTAKGIYLYAKPPRGGKRDQSKKTGVNDAVYKIFRSSGPAKTLSTHDIQQRLALVFINESIKCLDDNILAHPYDGDVGAVFGLGFPPFLGGPFYYADVLGAPKLLEDLNRLQQQLGPSFKPAASLSQQAESGGYFYQPPQRTAGRYHAAKPS